MRTSAESPFSTNTRFLLGSAASCHAASDDDGVSSLATGGEGCRRRREQHHTDDLLFVPSFGLLAAAAAMPERTLDRGLDCTAHSGVCTHTRYKIADVIASAMAEPAPARLKDFRPVGVLLGTQSRSSLTHSRAACHFPCAG